MQSEFPLALAIATAHHTTAWNASWTTGSHADLRINPQPYDLGKFFHFSEPWFLHWFKKKKNRPLQKSTYLRTGMRITEMTSAWYGAWDPMQLDFCPSLSPTAGPSSWPVLRFPQPPVTEAAMCHLFLPSLLRLSSGEPPLSHEQVFPQPSAHPPHPVLLSSICAPVSHQTGSVWRRAHLTHLRASRVQHWPGPG